MAMLNGKNELLVTGIHLTKMCLLALRDQGEDSDQECLLGCSAD